MRPASAAILLLAACTSTGAGGTEPCAVPAACEEIQACHGGGM